MDAIITVRVGIDEDLAKELWNTNEEEVLSLVADDVRNCTDQTLRSQGIGGVKATKAQLTLPLRRALEKLCLLE